MNCLKFIAKIFILCTVLLATVSATPQKHKASDGREYLIETDPKYNWYQAFHECARRDSQLVIMDSADKYKAFVALLKKVVGQPKDLWLGGNDEYSSSKSYSRPFYWSATGQNFNFAFWSENNPDNYGNEEHCVHIWGEKPNFQWNDIRCTYSFGFVCEANHYLEKYQTELKNKCAAVTQKTSAIGQDFNKTQQQQLAAIDDKLKKLGSLEENLKLELQQLQDATQAAIQYVIAQQQVQIDQLAEKMFQQVSALSDELKKSTSDINSEFAEKLNGSLTFPAIAKYLIVIKQGG